MDMRKYYILKDGTTISHRDLLAALHITRGEGGDTAQIENFISTLMSTGAIAKTQDDFTVEELASIHLYPEAAKLYREQTGCTLSEAKSYVDKLRCDPLK